MAQTLIVCRKGKGWVARDVTGATYGYSLDIHEAIAAAERLASRIGGSVTLSPEAEKHVRRLPPNHLL